MNRYKLKKKNRILKKKQEMLIKDVKKELLKINNNIYIDVFKRGDYSFLESLINTYNRLNMIRKRNKKVIKITKLEELINVTSLINLNKQIMNSKPVKFTGDIIITDPCYVYKQVDLAKVHHILRDTIYGDWGCTTFNSDTRKPIGKFCADSGMVGVLSLDDILKENPNFDNYKNEEAFTVIRGFDGYVQFIVEDFQFEWEDKKYTEYNVKVKGVGNINFITSQTSM